jgi:predicted ATPase
MAERMSLEEARAKNKAPQAIGSWRILDLLGQGGMGVVYRAVQVQSGKSAALKTVRVPSAGLLQSLRREIHALSRIRHPGVVRILDEGLEDGVPWYAMELLEGKTLRQTCDQLAAAAPEGSASGPSAGAAPKPKWWTQSLVETTSQAPHKSVGPTGLLVSGLAAPEPGLPLQPAAKLRLPAAGGALGSVLTLMRRLCEPLAFLHGEGIVHCDLKPENVLIRPDGRPVLMDFGLAGRFSAQLSREELELWGAGGGTVAYMAPEQGRGELVDARADLYSLGCILYELLTARRPFVGASPVQVLHQHFAMAPIAPSELVDGVTPELDALVLRLLAKDARKRLSHADDLAAALAGLGAQDGLAASGPKPRAYLYRPGFAGREAPLRQLEEALSKLERGSGALVLIGGESGVGKTRLVLELARQSRLRRIQVLTSECTSVGAPEPLHALRGPLQQVADRCRERGLTETERLLGARGKLLALYEPALAGLPGQEAYPEPVELPAEAARLRLYSYLTETFTALAEDRAVLLVLDDLQWADELTLGWLEFLLRGGHLGARRAVALLVLGTYRTEESSAALQKLLQAPGATGLELGRLGTTEVGAMVSDMLALSPPPEDFVSFLTRHSEGNPFFVGEYLRTALAEGLLYRNAAGQWEVAAPEPGEERSAQTVYEALPLPRSIQELVGRRLEGLSAAGRQLVEAAAVLGREVEEPLLLGMARESGAEELETLGELIARQVLQESEAGRLRFVHDKIREVAYGQLAEDRRQKLHRAAAEAVETCDVKERDEHLASLGHHWEQAGEAEKARPCYLAAARQAKRRYAHREAERLYRAYQRLVEEPTRESIEARNEFGADILSLQGQNQEALEQLGQACEEARAMGDLTGHGAALVRMGRVHRNVGRIEQGRGLYEQALAVFRELGDRRSEAKSLGNIGITYVLVGRFEQAADLLVQALAICREQDDRGGIALNLHDLGSVYQMQARLEEARALFEQAIPLAREAGDLRLEALCLNSIARLHELQNRVEEALALVERSIAILREIGDRRLEASSLGHLASLEMHAGRLDRAAALYEQALTLQRQVGDGRGQGVISANYGLLCLQRGEVEQARSLLQQALELERQAGDRRAESLTLVNSAALERRAGELHEAERLLERAEPLLREIGDSLHLALGLCERGHLELARGRPAAALLQQVEELAVALGLAPRSEPGQDVSRLRQAVEAFEASRPLFRGELVEDLPEGLRRHLIETGQLL